MQQLVTGKKRLLDENGVRFSGGVEESKTGCDSRYKQWRYSEING